MAALRDWGSDKGQRTAPEVPAIAEPAGTLTASEREEFARLRVVIRKGLGTFVLVGKALKRVRDGKLHRETHATSFEEWCRDEYDLSKTSAHRQIATSDVAELLGLSPTGDTMLSEACLRPLTKLKNDLVLAVWKRSVEEAPAGPDGRKRVTAEIVKQSVTRLAPKRTTKSKKPKKPRPIKIRVDGVGSVVVTLAKLDGDVVALLTAALAQVRPKQRKAA